MSALFLVSPQRPRLFAAAFLLGLSACSAFADVVTDWNATLENAMRNPAPAPDVQTRSAAIMHVAVFDAVNGIAKKYAPLRITAPAPAGARAEAAAAQAAYTALVGLFPSRQADFDVQLAASLAQISAGETNSQSIALGRAWGESVAKEILAWRATDGFSTVLTYTGTAAPGDWRHSSNATGPNAGLSMTATAPFALTNLASFDPGPPYGTNDRAAALATPAYTADFNEVKAKGGATSSGRTRALTDLAVLIHTTDPTDTNAHVRRSLPANAKLVDNARTFALLNMAGHDATVVCFQSKYKYGFWRPFQAVVFADQDGNAATVADPTWVPLVGTPPHPEYLSGHAIVISSMLGIASAILGDDTPFVLTTSKAGAPAIAPTFSSFSAFSDAGVEARINAGVHFRTSCTVGQSLGYAIAGQIMRSALLPASGSGVINLALRGRTGVGSDTLIAGFVVGSGSRQILVRGVGPTLAMYGVTGSVADPRVVIFDRAGRTVASNDNWSAGDAAATAALTTAAGKVGAFPLATGSLDAALLTTLVPGTYTVHLSGATGVALIEAYEVP